MKTSLNKIIIIIALSIPFFFTGKAEARWGALADDAIRWATNSKVQRLAAPASRHLCKALPFLYEKPIFTASKDSRRNGMCPWEAAGNALVLMTTPVVLAAGLIYIDKLNR